MWRNQLRKRRPEIILCGARDMPIRVIVIADVRLYRDGLVAALRDYDALAVVGSGADHVDAMRLIDETHPEVAVIDMGISQACNLVRDVNAHTAATRILAFAVEEAMETILECAEAGASGYVTLDASLDELVDAIVRIAACELVCPPKVAAMLFRSISERERRDAAASETGALTTRERQVLAFLTRGLTNKEIASTLNISQATVKNHVHHLLEKLDVGTRAQAVARAQIGAGRRRDAVSRREA